jgi:hypothetical protein
MEVRCNSGSLSALTKVVVAFIIAEKARAMSRCSCCVVKSLDVHSLLQLLRSPEKDSERNWSTYSCIVNRKRNSLKSSD